MILEEGKKLHEKDKNMYLINADIGGLVGSVTTMIKQRTGNQLMKDDYTPGFAKEDLIYGMEWVKKALDVGVFQPVGETQLFIGKWSKIQNGLTNNPVLLQIGQVRSTVLKGLYLRRLKWSL